MEIRLTPAALRCLAVCFGCGSILAAPSAERLEMLQERGVLFYAPFEGSVTAVVAGGQAAPWVQRGLKFGEGRVGQAILVSNRLGGMHANSLLAYEAAGNINRRRGSIAFWIKAPWDGNDRNVLTGSTYQGPSILGIAGTAKDPFFYFQRRKGWFEIIFDGKYLSGPKTHLHQRYNMAVLGEYYGGLNALWQKDVWQHVTITWDDRSGWDLYFNGERKTGFHGEIEWELHRPDTIGLGHRPLSNRSVLPVTSDFWFDEFLVFLRPLGPDEVKQVMAGNYAELRSTALEDWGVFDAQARRRALRMEPAAAHPAVTVAAGSASLALRQVAVGAVDMNFFGGHRILDGNFDTEMTFRDGGYGFDTPARFRFLRSVRANLAVVDSSNPQGAFFFEGDESRALGELRAGRTCQVLDGKRRESCGIFFPGGATVQEVAFFDTTPVPAGLSGTRYGLHGPATISQAGKDIAEVLLVEAENPRDRAILLAGVGVAGGTVISRDALAHTFLVLAPSPEERFIDLVRLRLQVRAAGGFGAALRIFDPQIPGHINFHSTLQVDGIEADAWTDLDVAAGPAGLIVPAQKSLLMSFTADRAIDINLNRASSIEILKGHGNRVGQEFALAQMRVLWPAVLRGINANNFVTEGETRDTSRIGLGLRRVLKYDPGNALARTWLCWGRLGVSWPPYDFSSLERETGPRWAVYLREAVQSMQAVIHWWLEHRSNEDGYLAGPGDQWNDITKLYNKYLSLGALVSDTRLVEAAERYLDAHWNTGRMVDGYAWMMTDMVHSCEEASYIQPSLHVLRPGIPRHVYRDLRTAANLERWLGTNSRGQLLFRSNQFNARNLESEGVFARDPADADSATVPAKYLHWYSGHPQCGQWILALADAWLQATRQEAQGKKAGAIPGFIDFHTGVPHPGNPGMAAERFLTAYQFSGDSKYLAPLAELATQGGQVSTLPPQHVFYSHALHFLAQAILDDGAPLAPSLRQQAEAQLKSMANDGFFQRGIESYEARAALLWVVEPRAESLLEMLKYVARNNRRAFPVYTETEPPTDRVYPWGRVILPVVMLGGRLFDGRAANPVPMAAFAWENTDNDVVSMVTERQRDRINMLVYNFKQAEVRAGLRALDLPEGRYLLAVTEWNEQERREVGKRREREVAFRRFTGTPVDLPARQTVRISLTLLERRPVRPRPDLAVTLAQAPSQDGALIARVHNLGTAGVAKAVVILQANGAVLATAEVRDLPALTGFEPSFVDLQLNLPAGAGVESAGFQVDPDNEIDEINEANNLYLLRKGVPPPVETQKPPYSGHEKVEEIRW